MKTKRLLIGIALIALTSCGQDVALAMDRTTYHTDVFSNNMYDDTVMETRLSPEHIASTQTYPVDGADVFEGVAELKTADRYYNDGTGTREVNDEFYATTKKLSLTLPEIKYGFESKLFDGILHCSDAVRISKSRLQLRESGFGYVFPKAITSLDHVGLYLKAGADTYLGGVYITDLRVHVSFYVPTGDQYAKHEFTFDVAGVRRSDFPELYGFYLDDVAGAPSLNGATAVSVSYDILDVAAENSNHDYTAIFLYELLLPKSVWA
ncbi:MAG: hypothetical protein WC399_00545 [Bacilli bacterium]|jgi:hypothetical protein